MGDRGGVVGLGGLGRAEAGQAVAALLWADSSPLLLSMLRYH